MKMNIAEEVMKRRKAKKMAEGGMVVQEDMDSGLDNGSDGDTEDQDSTLKELSKSIPDESEEDPDTKMKSRVKRIFSKR